MPEVKIENVTLSNIRLTFEGGGTKADAGREIPEKPADYPEYSMFGKLSAYGLYCRHVKDLKLLNVQLQLEKPDQRYAVVLEDVEDGLINGLDAQRSPEGGEVINFTNVKNLSIRNEL
jgi:hypothetical protein